MESKSSTQPFFILSCDGGGIRGLITLHFLLAMETDIQATIDPHFQVSGFFDMFAGTSAGGILMGLCAFEQQSMATIEKLYGPPVLQRIFSKSWYDRIFGVLQRRPKYTGLEKQRLTQAALKEKTLADTAKHLVIPAYDLRHRAHIFNSRDADSHRYKAAAVLDATSAAPGYFPAVRVGSSYYLDGALFALNPTMCAIAAAIKVLREEKMEQRPIVVLSVGTGTTERATVNATKAVRYGGIQWLMKDLLTIPLEDSEINGQAASIVERFLRIDGSLGKLDPALDKTTNRHMTALCELGQAWWRQNRSAVLGLLGL